MGIVIKIKSLFTSFIDLHVCIYIYIDNTSFSCYATVAKLKSLRVS